LLVEAKNALLKAGFAKVDYIELRDGNSLVAVKSVERPARLLAAAYLGTTRLIDNIEV
jgi:pantoate--beta-alanine ligase